MSNEKESAGLTVHEPEVKAATGPEVGGPVKKGGAWTARLALLLALAALLLSLLPGRAVEKASVTSINRMITDTVVPEMKRSRERDLTSAIYDLKRVEVTLEEIKEITDNEEIKIMVDKMKKEVEELSVKLFVHE